MNKENQREKRMLCWYVGMSYVENITCSEFVLLKIMHRNELLNLMIINL